MKELEQLLHAFDPPLSPKEEEQGLDGLSQVELASMHASKTLLAFQEYSGLDPTQRWPTLLVSDKDSPLSDDRDLHTIYPIKLPTAELLNVHRALDTQVENRDLRLLDQSHFLIVWRPTANGDPSFSSGVLREASYARDTQCPIIFYIKQGSDPLPKSSLVPNDPTADPDYIFAPTDELFWKRIAALHNDPIVTQHGRDHFLR